MEEWKTVYKSTTPISAKIIEHKLCDRDIPAVLINTIDSSYNAYGIIEVKVPKSNFSHALHIIEELNENKCPT